MRNFRMQVGKLFWQAVCLIFLACGKIILGGAKIILESGKIILSSGTKIILASGKIIFGGANFFLASWNIILGGAKRCKNYFGRWEIIYAGLVTTRQSHLVRASKFLKSWIMECEEFILPDWSPPDNPGRVLAALGRLNPVRGNDGLLGLSPSLSDPSFV